MIMAVIFIVVGLLLLIWGADKMVDGAVSIAAQFGVSQLVIGMTIVAIGTSAPEIFVALMAATKGLAAMAIGNSIGSNIANVGLVLGLTAVVAPLNVSERVFQKELPVLFLVMLLVAVLFVDGYLRQFDGFVLLLALVGFLAWLLFHGGKAPVENSPFQPQFSLTVAIAWTVVGSIGLLLGAHLLVSGAVGIAQMLGLSDLVIGLTIVAIGTSLPEVAASMMAAMKGKADLAVGNVIGSNVFNLLAVLLMPALFAPGPLEQAVLRRDYPVMVGLTALVYFMLVSTGRVKRMIGRFQGGVLLAMYVGYLGLLYWQS